MAVQWAPILSQSVDFDVGESMKKGLEIRGVLDDRAKEKEKLDILSGGGTPEEIQEALMTGGHTEEAAARSDIKTAQMERAQKQEIYEQGKADDLKARAEQALGTGVRILDGVNDAVTGVEGEDAKAQMWQNYWPSVMRALEGNPEAHAMLRDMTDDNIESLSTYSPENAALLNRTIGIMEDKMGMGESLKWEPVRDDKGNIIAQRNRETGETKTDPRAVGGEGGKVTPYTDAGKIQADVNSGLLSPEQGDELMGAPDEKENPNIIPGMTIVEGANPTPADAKKVKEGIEAKAVLDDLMKQYLEKTKKYGLESSTGKQGGLMLQLAWSIKMQVKKVEELGALQEADLKALEQMIGSSVAEGFVGNINAAFNPYTKVTMKGRAVSQIEAFQNYLDNQYDSILKTRGYKAKKEGGDTDDPLGLL